MSQEVELVIGPAVAGVENVLGAVRAAGGVRRVVMTSSVAAVVGDHWERGQHHVFTEADWNLTATATHLPYHRSRAAACQQPLSERESCACTRKYARRALSGVKCCAGLVLKNRGASQHAKAPAHATAGVNLHRCAAGGMRLWVQHTDVLLRGRSKLLAEQRAYELCEEQSAWSLVTIQPPVIQGPPPGMWQKSHVARLP